MKFYSYLKITCFVFLAFLIFIFSFDLGLQYIYQYNNLQVNIGYMLIWSVLLAFVLSALIGFAAFLLITRPVEWLTQVIKSVTANEFDKKIFLRSNDELQALAEAADELAGKIKYSVHSEAVERSRLEAVFLNMFEGVMIVDQDGLVVLMNQKLKELINVREDFKNRSSIEVVRNSEIQELISNALKTGQGVETKELKILFPLHEKILLVSAAPVYWGQQIQGVVLVFHDISEVRKLEKVRRDFVANVSHELRTPIANIHGYAETLLDGAINDPKHNREFLNVIYHDSGRLSKLVADLLNLSRIESGKWEMNIKECSIHKIIDRVLASLRPVIQQKGAKVQVNISEQLPTVKVDEVGLEQVLFNITENALKYGQPDGLVKIDVTDAAQNFCIKITDNGMGISREDQPRIFERFYRVDKARSLHEGGTGLGLAIVKHIVELMHGRIQVESELGQGSSFFIELPRIRGKIL
ncbi:MAG: PAS domain-containing protein [Candidatus Omnitrophica bacterium]|nr:PAS domain-containing protein [Candidatus Omnitrophota bacterium]